MKLYVTFNADPATAFPVWSTSQNAASKAKTAMTAELKEKEEPHRGVEFKMVEVPTKKDELVAFLSRLAANGPADM